MVLLSGAAFGAFVLSRMVMGLAKEPASRMLRAGGNYLTGNCFLSIILVVVLGLADFGFRTPRTDRRADHPDPDDRAGRGDGA